MLNLRNEYYFYLFHYVSEFLYENCMRFVSKNTARRCLTHSYDESVVRC